MKHTTPTPSGTRAQIRIHGELHRKHFPTGTPTDTIRKWLLITEMKFRGRKPTRTGRFDDDAAVYLEAVKAMPSYSDRALHIKEWIGVFGNLERDVITADMISAALHRWRTEPRQVNYTRRGGGKPKSRTLILSASAVNKRRTALQHMFTTLDGKAAPNPVKDVPKFREPDASPGRALTYADIRKVFLAMGDTPSRARLMVMAYVGLPHRQIATLTPADVDVTRATVIVSGRRKGKGTSVRIVPLTPAGVRALKAMKKHDCWGPFSRSSLHKRFREACKKALGRTDVTPYDLRHSFGTEVYRRSGDIRATQVLMGHSTPTLTHRYTLAAVDPRVLAALKGFGR